MSHAYLIGTRGLCYLALRTRPRGASHVLCSFKVADPVFDTELPHQDA